ncbi:hypothetical protein CVT25_007009 [Psilocybe cyanescens]|uniref:C2H2-type domain-containing protein n=1 Tax=Psilocybe cyanescens TaxID=93625 RepID=A0A409WYB7_PSICY|nr:hypothetical protein CVT25_007009 [Psilocybe cyanescens]
MARTKSSYSRYVGKTVIGAGTRMKAEMISYGAIRQYQQPPQVVPQQQTHSAGIWSRRVVSTVVYDEVFEYRSSASPLEPPITAFRQPNSNSSEESGPITLRPTAPMLNFAASSSKERTASFPPPSGSTNINPVAAKSLVTDQRRKILERQIHDPIPEDMYTVANMYDASGCPVKGFQCIVCKDIGPMVPGDFRRHLLSRIHTPPQKTCQECNKSFTRKDSLKRHVKREHPEAFKSLYQE